MLFRSAAVAVFALAASGPALADDNQLWSSVNVSGPATQGSRVLLWFDGHARFREDGQELDVTLFRPGVGYRINPKLDVWAGYVRVAARRDGPDLIEDRAWQQATYQLAEAAGSRLSGRTRLEQRFRDTGDDTGWRVRQQLRFVRPVAGTPLSLVAHDEIFFSLNDADWGQRSGFDQNRAFLGGAWQATKPVRLEAGYLNQHIKGAGPAPDRTNHILSVGVFIGL